MGLVALALVVLFAVATGLSAGWQRREGVTAACARIFEDKADLSGYKWGWLPPGWVCTYGNGEDRRLPFMQR